MYSDVFCKVYNEFGWNYYPEAFGGQLLRWMEETKADVKSALDLACGTGILCRILHETGVAACGADLSEGMIAIAREHNPEIPFEVADMITYRPEEQFDLVTCTGDALNHIMSLADVKTIFRNVHCQSNILSGKSGIDLTVFSSHIRHFILEETAKPKGQQGDECHGEIKEKEPSIQSILFAAEQAGCHGNQSHNNRRQIPEGRHWFGLLDGSLDIHIGGGVQRLPALEQLFL